MNLDINLDVRLACKLIKFATKTSSKTHEPKTYNKVIDNQINRNK